MLDPSENSLFIVLSNPQQGKDEEFNQWYDNHHLPEVSALDGFISAKRYKVSASQMTDESQSHQYVAVYEVEKGKEALAVKSLQRAIDPRDRLLTPQDSMDALGVKSIMIECITGLVRGEDFKK
jgi:Domain of unknown function (DUF4286)